MPKQRPEKKTEMLEVRLSHSKKAAFKQACEDEGISVSHAVRTFVDAYLKRSRRTKVKRIAKDISMTLIRNPIKTTGSLGGMLAASFGLAALVSTPSYADRDVQPISLPTPEYPEALAVEGVSAVCLSYFDVTAEGYVTNLEVDCGHPGFVNATRNAVATLRFEPKMKDGKPILRKGIVYPMSFLINDENGNPIEPLRPEPRG